MLLQIDAIQDGMWALLLGPAGLLVASIIVNIVLWRKINRIEKEHQEEIKQAHQDRHSDLVTGLKYREEIGKSLLQDNVEDRVTANKMIDAMKSLSAQQEKTDETVQVVKESVQAIKSRLEAKGR